VVTTIDPLQKNLRLRTSMPDVGINRESQERSPGLPVQLLISACIRYPESFDANIAKKRLVDVAMEW
jgi:hypothetical protein